MLLGVGYITVDVFVIGQAHYNVGATVAFFQGEVFEHSVQGVPVDPVGKRGVYDPDSFLVHVSYCGMDYKVFERIRLVRGSDIVLVVKVITGRKGDENKVSCLDAILSGRTAAGPGRQQELRLWMR